jgi:putative FmdB family regulatory protein
MPIYEYECPSCGHEFEKIQKFSDPEVKKCPECGLRVRKKISASAFMLKGGGWYADGYSGKAEKKKSRNSNSESGASDSGKGDAKASKKSNDSSASASSS